MSPWMQNKPLRSQYRLDVSSDACARLHQEEPQKFLQHILHLFSFVAWSLFYLQNRKVPWLCGGTKLTASSVMYSQGKTLVVRAIFLIVYGFVGAAVFTLLEKREESSKTTSNGMLEELRKNFTKHQNISEEEFKFFTMAVYNAVRVGLSADWTYFRAVDFTYTALTTIG